MVVSGSERLASSPPSSVLPRGLLGYRPELEEEIFAFQVAAYPHRTPALIPARWRWMFLESASRLGVAPQVWVYRSAQGVMAHQGGIAVRAKLGPDEHVTGWFVETMALESVRRKGVGAMLVKKALADLPTNLSLGQTEEMRQLQFALGWRSVVPLHSYALILRPERVLSTKISNGLLRKAVGRTMMFHAGVHRTLSRRGQQRGTAIEELDRFDERHDDLWRRVRGHFTCAVVRDASFLNWKFVDQPGHDFVRLHLLRDGRVDGVATMTCREPNDSYPYRRAFLSDLVVDPSDRSAIRILLDAVRSQAQHLGADILMCDLTHATLEGALRSYGFVARPSTRVLLVASDDQEPEKHRLMSTPNSWLLTRADSDIDRPW